MRIYYLMNPELGWDNVCALGRTLKEMAQNYYEDEDLSLLTNKEIEDKIDKDNMAYSDRELKIKEYNSDGWDCHSSPTKYCDYKQADGSFDEDHCIYCGQPEERK